MRQPANPLFQAVWTFLHLQAAALHIASALYHLSRVQGEPLDDIEQSGDSGDLTYAEALDRARDRQA